MSGRWMSGLFAGPNEDDMANNWGTNFVTDVTTKSATYLQLDSLLRLIAPGYRPRAIVADGTTANDKAIGLTTGGCYSRTLFAMGSYAGGTYPLQTYSTSKSLANNQLALVAHPDACDDGAKTNTVAFPYHIPNDALDDEVLQELENKCLQALDERLMTSALMGNAIKALLMEYILAGSGGELTERFLVKLSRVLKRFNVVIIADEVMTGGRVGPTFARTSILPNEFQERVAFITLGKSIGCGIVLEKTVGVLAENKGRGNSTTIEEGEAYHKIRAIYNRIKDNWITIKRDKILSTLKLTGTKNTNHHWGQGLLIFVSKARPGVMGCLKNRLLAKLEVHSKTKLTLGCKNTEWNRVTVNNHLMEATRAWLANNANVQEALLVSPYTAVLAEFLCTRCQKTTAILPSELDRYIDTTENIDKNDLRKLHQERKRKRLGKQHGRCAKQHKNLVFEAFKEAATMSKGFMNQTLKTKKRMLCYEMNFDELKK